MNGWGAGPCARWTRSSAVPRMCHSSHHTRMRSPDMGPLGSGGHTPNETLELDSMALAIKRAALLMYRLSHTQDVSESRD